ncbi:SRPBCC family protein [Xanthocytophaga flava]|uniref:SRPBCC family protein n=1 Tax=Xanthocytophaga flava TaxID=3048013 RepID=UPI0028D19AC6|nr:hypothetical protein [Xanthocytophaga flavus]MDJ1471585.1 hypothetical protein [Xanthocytophaga flavus]
MYFEIVTEVKANFETVVANFDQRLLTKVSPSFPPARLLRYDGNMPGNEVHVELNFLLFRQVWKSKIISFQKNEEDMVFVDEGTELPFFLSYWHHEHRVERKGQSSLIRDKVTFRTPLVITDYLMFPAMYLQFWSRKAKYRRYFRNLVFSEGGK